jgi:hypothetical protein
MLEEMSRRCGAASPYREEESALSILNHGRVTLSRMNLLVAVPLGGLSETVTGDDSFWPPS